MIPREAESEIRILARQFKAVAVIGPRQSGKTTLVKYIFTEKPYVSLENPDLRMFALEDPRGFLANYPQGAILDEVQRVPEIFSYLQQILDESGENGLFILTGSNNFLLQEHLSQSLSGRVGYINLLPLSLGEINDTQSTTTQLMFKGGYPALHSEQIDPARWFPNYIRTYIERDVRMIKNITNLTTFERFLRLCAGRIGQLLNMSSLSVETGVDVKTISAWLSVLEASFILFRLQPYHENFNKRVVKMPKLYFYDTGIAVSLLGIDDPAQLEYHPLRGSLFENMIIAEYMKKLANAGKPNQLYFWRDNVGNEVDLLWQQGNSLVPIEIKSGQTITNEYLRGISFWNKISQTQGGTIIYGGEIKQSRSNGIVVLPFREL
ncbi:MAG: ATP-binding protein [Bacteroidales bacterium]|nr:ATP-binding protein [Bacteroidales bacterium]